MTHAEHKQQIVIYCLEDARVRQLKRTELARRVESAQCLRLFSRSLNSCRRSYDRRSLSNVRWTFFTRTRSRSSRGPRLIATDSSHGSHRLSRNYLTTSEIINNNYNNISQQHSTRQQREWRGENTKWLQELFESTTSTTLFNNIVLAFGKPVAKNDAHVIRRRLPPLSPQIKNLRGPRTLETYGEADRCIFKFIFIPLHSIYI